MRTSNVLSNVKYFLVFVRGIFFAFLSIALAPFFLLAIVNQKKIHKAAWRDDLAMLNSALKSGDSVDSRDRDGNTALHIAAMNGYNDIAHKLINSGAMIDCKNKDGITPIDIATISEKEGIVKLLANCSAEIGLITHVAEGNIEILQDYLEGGGDPNQEIGKFGSLLDLAIKFNQLEVAQILLTYKASLEDKSGISPLLLAARKGNFDLVKLLVEHGAALNCEHARKTPLHEAVSHGHLDIVQYLLERGADVNAKDTLSGGYTPLYEAISINRTDIVDILMSHGADIHAKASIGGLTSLELAQKNPEMMAVISKFL